MGRVAIISAGALPSKGPQRSVALDPPSPNMPEQAWILGEIGKEGAGARRRFRPMPFHHVLDGTELPGGVSLPKATPTRGQRSTISFKRVGARCCSEFRSRGLSAA